MVAGLYFIYSAPFEIIVASLFLYKYVFDSRSSICTAILTMGKLTDQHSRMGRLCRCRRPHHRRTSQLIRI